MLKKCKEIVTLLRKSSVEKGLFYDVELDEDVPTHRYRLQQMVVTRWGSRLAMLETFIKAKDRLIIYMAKSTHVTNTLNSSD